MEQAAPRVEQPRVSPRTPESRLLQRRTEEQPAKTLGNAQPRPELNRPQPSPRPDTINDLPPVVRPKDTAKKPTVVLDPNDKKPKRSAPPPPERRSDFRFPGRTPDSDRGQVNIPPPQPGRPEPQRPHDPGKIADSKKHPRDHDRDRHIRYGDWRYFHGPGYTYGRPWDPFWGEAFYWNGAYHYWGGRYYSPFDNVYGWNWYQNDWYEKRYSTDPEPSPLERIRENDIPFFFPPFPPPVGVSAPLPDGSSLTEAAPKTLGMYLNESFYPQLGTRLRQGLLTKEMESLITKYRQKKLEETRRLREKLAEVAARPLEERKALLQSFAGEQRIRLQELEREEERIRSGLLSRRLGEASIDWNSQREWKLADSSDQDADARKRMLFLVVRAAAHYRSSLSASQRRLAAEAAMEIQMELFREAAGAASEASETILFFSPEKVQIRLPHDLPESLRIRLGVYAETKARLRGELVAAIEAADDDSDVKRKIAFEALARRQASSLDALEVMADEIRTEIIRTNSQFEPPARLGLPAKLIERLTTFNAEKEKLRRELARLHENLAARLAAEEKTGSSATSTLDGEPPASGPSEQLARELEEFRQKNSTRFAELDSNMASIKTELDAHLEQKGMAGRDINKLTAELTQWVRQQDYQTAVFEPGLSLEQRRLLFDAALEEMDMPLPRRE